MIITTIPIQYIIFAKGIQPYEIQCFRGAIIQQLGGEANPLLHNHKKDGLRYGYPLVQYKLQNGHPMIIALGDAIIELNPLLALSVLPLHIGNRDVNLKFEKTECYQYKVEVKDAPKYYSICNYIPLTESNVAKYESLLSLTDRICFLENILIGNILSFFKGIGYHAEEKLEVTITDMKPQKSIRYKSVNFQTFDLHFVSNVLLPDRIGLGKSTSIGFGTVIKESLPERFKKQYHE